MNLNISCGVKTIKYLELNPSPTNCQYPEMGIHFEYVNPKLSAACTAMRAGTSLTMRQSFPNLAFISPNIIFIPCKGNCLYLLFSLI
jgi:hypothetical protein